MSLEDAPEASLEQLAGELDTLQSEWAIAMTPGRRKEIDDEFKALSDKIMKKYGAEGLRVVDRALAKNRRLFAPTEWRSR